MEGHALISSDILASYAADAACEVAGVRGLVESALHRHKGVKVGEEDGGAVTVELHLAVDWGSNVPELGAAVQERVAAYLQRMADVRASSIDVVVDEIAPPSA
jgi:uncharacterized alkaline shock family protein YloU